MSPEARPIEDHSELQSEHLIQKVLRALSGIRYGSVEIIIHDARVVQIERKEKLRFDQRDVKKDR